MDQWAESRRRALTDEIRTREAGRPYDPHGRTLTTILAHQPPPGYRRGAPPRRPTTAPVLPVIRQTLDDDTKAPKEPRHTARRTWQRRKDEHGFAGGYTAVTDAVREMTVGRQEVSLPRSHPPGEGPVGDGFAGAVFVRADPRECAETFPDGPVRAFGFFGGVPKRIAYDNTTTAVAKILGRRDREATREFARSGTVASLPADDRAAFRPIPARPFEARRVTEAGADARSLVRFDTHAYAVPTRYARRTRTVIGTVAEVRIAFEDRLVARHPRCWDREQSVYDPVHYLALLERKPGGFDFARRLEGWDLPGCFDVLRRRLDAAARDGHGTRAFVRVRASGGAWRRERVGREVRAALRPGRTGPGLGAAAERLLDLAAGPHGVRGTRRRNADRRIDGPPDRPRPVGPAHRRTIRDGSKRVKAYSLSGWRAIPTRAT